MKMDSSINETQHLMAAIREGGVSRERAVSSLYAQLQGYVSKGMQRYQMSENLAQEAFLLALQKVVQAIEWGQFEGKSKISTYFHPIFFHRCVDILRRESSHIKAGGLEDYMMNMPDMAQDILRDLQAREELSQLHVLMEKLGEKCKALLTLTEWKGLSLKSVARQLGYRSAAVAGTTKNRCLARLKALTGPTT